MNYYQKLIRSSTPSTNLHFKYNITILAYAVLLTVCSQACSYTNASIQEEIIYEIGLKVNQLSTPWSVSVCQISGSLLSASPDIFFTRLFLYDVYIRKGAYLLNDKTGGGKNAGPLLENLTEHGIHCLPCSFTNDVIDVTIATVTLY